MSSVATGFKPTSRRQYITTGDFHNDFFAYSTYFDSSDFTTKGRLTLVPGATSGNCGENHVLRENGKRLIKGADPNLNDPNNTSNEYTYLIGVFDTVTFLNGYIDPNCQLFAPYNTDKSYSIDQLTQGYNAARDTQDQGPPVYTQGDIKADGNLTIGGDTLVEGTSEFNGDVTVVGKLDVSGQIRCTTLSNFGTITGTRIINVSAAQFFTLTSAANSGNGIDASNVSTGDTVNLYVTLPSAGNTLVFGTNIREATSGVPAVAQLLSNNGGTQSNWLVSFIGLSNSLLEMSRTCLNNA